jgi:hypothetical protein
MKHLNSALIPVLLLVVPAAGMASGKAEGAKQYAGEPSSGKAITAQSAAAVTDRTTNPEFSAEQRAWEKILAENLGSFYYPLYLKSKEKGSITAWDYVKDDPALPRMLLIGDSISRGCTVPLRNALKGKVNVHRAPANCGPSRYGLEKLDIWMGAGVWDMVVINFGIHDRRTPTETYTANLEELIARIRPRTKQILWVTTTPVPAGAGEYVEGSIERLNGAATPLMQKLGIAVIDLHAAVLPKVSELQLPENCHFKGEGYDFMGAFLAENVLKYHEKGACR